MIPVIGERHVEGEGGSLGAVREDEVDGKVEVVAEDEEQEVWTVEEVVSKEEVVEGLKEEDVENQIEDVEGQIEEVEGQIEEDLKEAEEDMVDMVEEVEVLKHRKIPLNEIAKKAKICIRLGPQKRDQNQTLLRFREKELFLEIPMGLKPSLKTLPGL